MITVLPPPPPPSSTVTLKHDCLTVPAEKRDIKLLELRRGTIHTYTRRR